MFRAISLCVLWSPRFADINCSWNSSGLSLPSQTQIRIQCLALSVNTEVQVKSSSRIANSLKVTPNSVEFVPRTEKKNCPLENPGMGKREKRWERTYTYRCAVEWVEYFTWAQRRHIPTFKGSSFSATSLSRRTAGWCSRQHWILTLVFSVFSETVVLSFRTWVRAYIQDVPLSRFSFPTNTARRKIVFKQLWNKFWIRIKNHRSVFRICFYRMREFIFEIL